MNKSNKIIILHSFVIIASISLICFVVFLNHYEITQIKKIELESGGKIKMTHDSGYLPSVAFIYASFVAL